MKASMPVPVFRIDEHSCRHFSLGHERCPWLQMTLRLETFPRVVVMLDVVRMRQL